MELEDYPRGTLVWTAEVTCYKCGRQCFQKCDTPTIFVVLHGRGWRRTPQGWCCKTCNGGTDTNEQCTEMKETDNDIQHSTTDYSISIRCNPTSSGKWNVEIIAQETDEQALRSSLSLALGAIHED